MHIAVVGMGIAGHITALALLKQSATVHLFDDPKKKATASVAAAMLSPCCELAHTSKRIYELGQISLTLWPQYLKQIGGAVYFMQQGSLYVAHHQDKAEYQRTLQSIARKLEPHAMQALNVQQLKQLEPELAHFNEAAYFPQEAHLDNRQFLASSLRYLKARTELTQAHVCAIAQGKVHTKETVRAFDWVFDCRGLGMQPQLKNLRGVRGEAVRLIAPEVNISRPVRLAHPRYPIYIVPRANNVYVVGASEIESADESPMSLRSCLELLSAAYSLHKGFAEARILSLDSGVRTALPDNLPCINHQNKYTQIGGLYRHGFLVAPALVQEALAHVTSILG